MSAIDEYVRQAMENIPPALAERGRIEVDLRAHLEETVAGEGTVQAAIARFGAPAEVARGYLADLPMRPASIGVRVVALGIDVTLGLLLFGILAALYAAYAFALSGPLDGEIQPVVLFGVASNIVLIAVVGLIATISLLSLLYFPLLEWRFGQTLGKRVMGIHVVADDGTAVGLGQAIVRRIPFFLEFFWIDAIVALFTERQQRAFDLVARTMVTEVGEARASAPVAHDMTSTTRA